MFNPQISKHHAAFKDRRDGGQQLGKKLLAYKKINPIILGLPRGGMVVAYEVAKRLNGHLEVLVVRKLGSPNNPEFAIGAIAENDTVFLDKDTIRALGISNKTLRELIEAENEELNRRVKIYRKGKEIIPLKNKVVIIVDDGLATGATAKASVNYVSKQKPKEIIFASPVCAYDSLQKLKSYVSKVVSILTPPQLTSISTYYESFQQTTDDDVIKLLTKKINVDK